MKVLGVIPARGGSTRIKLKNVADVGGYSLLYHAISQAAHAVRNGILVEACVSTDHPAIAASAHTLGCPIISRDKAGDGPMAPVLVEALDKMQRTFGRQYDAVACLQPTSPFRLPSDIGGVLALLEANPSAMSAVSVSELDGKRNGAVYITRSPMLRDGLVFDKHSLKYPMPADRSIDINTPADLERARELWAKLHG